MNYTYMLLCSDGTLYCGYTTDLKNRLKMHNSGKGAKYTRSRTPVRLVWFEEHADRHGAMSMECRIKRMTRAEKLELIKSAERRIAEYE